MWLLCGSEVQVVLRVFFSHYFQCDGKDKDICEAEYSCVIGLTCWVYLSEKLGWSYSVVCLVRYFMGLGY
jgi:hypothetical protein